MAQRRIILDTHTLLWALTDPSQLSRRARSLIRDRNVEIHVSAISAYEVSQLARRNRAEGSAEVFAYYAGSLTLLGVREIPLTSRVCLMAGAFTHDHGDPFDRIIATQGIVEGIPVVTVDRQIAEVGALTIW